jgi:hypothetical protein
MLSGAIIDYLELLAEVYLRMPTDDIKAVLREYARDQLRDVVEYKPQDKVLGEKKRIA